MRVIKAINLLLILFIIALSLNLVLSNKIGIYFEDMRNQVEALYGSVVPLSFDINKTKCLFHNDGKLNEIPIDSCCAEIQKQIACKQVSGQSDFKCFVSESSERYYLIDRNTINYCEEEGYNAKIK
jgi:hypothetical protein